MAILIEDQIGTPAGVTSEAYLRIKNANLAIVNGVYKVDGETRLWLSEAERKQDDILVTRCNKIPAYFCIEIPEDFDKDRLITKVAYELLGKLLEDQGLKIKHLP